MLDLFTIFSKGGIVLWYFQGTTQLFTPSVNALIKSVILQVKLTKISLDLAAKKLIQFRCYSTGTAYLASYIPSNDPEYLSLLSC